MRAVRHDGGQPQREHEHEQPANNIPANPAFAPYTSSSNDDPNKIVLLQTDPSAGASSPRFVLDKASADRQRHRLGLAAFDTSLSEWR